MKRLLSYFSFQGRTNRQRYWLTALSIFGLLFVSALVLSVLARLPVIGVIGAILLVAVILAAAVAGIANGARRLHDRGKTAWWLLVFQGVPAVLTTLRILVAAGAAQDPVGAAGAAGAVAVLSLIGLGFSIWGLVEVGILKGTAGPNRFGDDPLGQPMQEVFA